ncbi:extensin family protein [Mesorhizobium sp. CC13]|uniref:extensin-like domain-containing protein n=1 Tax=Mesorhizobium sp. CC13 TaxID=3029194 RepID=UPI003265337F
MAANLRAIATLAGETRSLVRARAFRLAASLAFTGVVVAACTTGDVFALKPAVDVGTQTASLPPVEVVPQQAAVAPEPEGAMIASAPQAGLDPVLDAQPVEPTLDAQAAEMGEITAESPSPVQTASLVPARGLATLVPSSPQTVAYPRLDDPSALPQVPQPRVPAVMPADEVQCRSDLRELGVKYQDLPTIQDSAACGVDYPVKVSAIGSVKMQPAATVSCAMAASFAAWTKRELVPAARLRYFSGVKTIHQGSSYSCRKIAGTRTLSEHGKGNALDIMRIELNSGRDIDVEKPGLFAFRTRGFLNTIRADGCNYFNTVLGPGYNYDHRDHFHFDIKQRRNGYRACR